MRGVPWLAPCRAHNQPAKLIRLENGEGHWMVYGDCDSCEGPIHWSYYGAARLWNGPRQRPRTTPSGRGEGEG